jgi:hypothetical protein
MGLFAEPKDRPVVRMLTEAGVFVPHHSDKVGARQVCTYCGDGFRFHYKQWISRPCIEKGGDEAFFHTPGGNGDPMRFALDSPLSMHFPDDWGRLKIAEIVETLGWTDELRIAVDQHRLVHHWPCKAAK